MQYMKTLLLIDTHALIYRFYHALPPLTTPQGKQMHAIYGLARMLFKVLIEKKPEYIAAAFDRPEKTFRKESFADYKAHRPPAPDDLIGQLQEAPKLFDILGISRFDRAGFEADDIIGTLALHLNNTEALTISILSGDLDLLQLVVDNKVIVEIIKGGMGNTDIYNEEAVIDRYGLTPRQLPDYKGLVGDTSDNIPGVAGVGGKTATELLKEFHSIEEVLDNTVIIKPSVAEKLECNKEKALLSKELATIKTDVAIPLPKIEDLIRKQNNKDAIATYLTSLGFTSLVQKVEHL